MSTMLFSSEAPIMRAQRVARDRLAGCGPARPRRSCSRPSLSGRTSFAVVGHVVLAMPWSGEAFDYQVGERTGSLQRPRPLPVTRQGHRWTEVRPAGVHCRGLQLAAKLAFSTRLRGRREGSWETAARRPKKRSGRGNWAPRVTRMHVGARSSTTPPVWAGESFGPCGLPR